MKHQPLSVLGSQKRRLLELRIETLRGQIVIRHRQAREEQRLADVSDLSALIRACKAEIAAIDKGKANAVQAPKDQGRKVSGRAR